MPDLKGEDPAYKAGIFREINHDRIIYNSMRQIVESGRLLFDSKGQFLFEFGPDYRFTDIMCSIYEEIIDKYEGRLQSGIKSAYEYFLLAAMRECYFMGDFKKARKYWGRLKERYPKDDYNMPLEEFVPSYIRDSMRHTGPGNIRRLVRALLLRAFFFLGAKSDDLAWAMEGKAKELCRQWNQMMQTEDTLRPQIRYDKIRESVLIDIFGARIPYPQEIVDNLMDRFSPELIEKYKAAAERLEEAQIEEPEEIPEELQKAREFKEQKDKGAWGTR